MRAHRTCVGEVAARLLLAPALLSAAAAAAGVEAPAGLGGPAFSASPAALLLAAVPQAPDDQAPAIVLVNDVTFEFDDASHLTRTLHVVFGVRSRSALEEWGSVGGQWAPWHQERPTIRARVVTADGAEHWLDPSTIAETAASEQNPLLFGDRRALHVPLPAVAPGSVAEVEVVTRDTEPFFGGGVTLAHQVGGMAPVRFARITVLAPAVTDIQMAYHGVAGEDEERGAADGTVRVSCSWHELPASKPPEPGLPADVAPFPYAAFATGESWRSVARRYHAIVEEQLAGADVAAFARDAAGGKRGRHAVAPVLAALRHTVRYTGVEFGNASIVPWKPAEVLARRYGDCKDQAALLVAMLRSLGVRASVALLATGPGPDVDAGLPGLGRFDHAIVRVEGDPPMWVDPSARYSRAGEMPLEDSDRLALTVSKDTVDLERTPAAPASENRLETDVEVSLNELGPARIVETVTLSGTAEQLFRARHAAVTAQELKDYYEAHVKQEYQAKSLGEVSTGDPEDLEQPMRVRIEALGAGRGVTEQSYAAVGISAASVLPVLPQELLPTERPGEPAAPQRSSPYSFAIPLRAETRFRITAPPGFTPRPLPRPESRTLGTVVYSTAFEATPAGDVVATLRLDTGPARITAEQFEAARKAIRELAEEPVVALVFDQVGEAHLAAGRVREALGEFGALVMLHPAEALHHTQRARALLAGGMGELARAEARRAVEVEPTSALAHRTLGWTLQHDLVGRFRTPGHDRGAAIAAYRTAKELDAKDVTARGELALLLEFGQDGLRFSDPASLQEAVAEYKSIRDELDDTRFDVNLALALAHAGRHQDLLDLVAELDKRPEAHLVAVIAAAVREGAAAGIAEAERRVPDLQARRATLTGASIALIMLRQYPAAAPLLDSALQGAADAAPLASYAEEVRRMRRVEDLPSDAANPVDVARAFLTAMLRPGPQEELRARLLPLVTPTSAAALTHHAGFVEELARTGRRLLDTFPMLDSHPAVSVDYTVSRLTAVVDGDAAGGWRVRFNDGRGSYDDLVLFLATEGGRPLVVGPRWPPTLIAGEIVARARSGDVAIARGLLDRLRDGGSSGRGDDPYATCGSLARFWTKGDTADPARMIEAAASLVAEGPQAAEAVPILEAARGAAGDDTERYDCALASAHSWAGTPDARLAVTDRLVVRFPSSFFALRDHLRDLLNLDRAREALPPAQAWVDAHAGDPWPVRLLADVQVGLGDIAGARATLAGLAESGHAIDDDWNNIAWYGLVLGQADATTLEQAKRSVEVGSRNDRAALHTLACVQAEMGDTGEAYRNIIAAIDLAGTIDSDDWFVFGRLAEWFDLPEAARAAYERVTPPQRPTARATSTHLLAARRLALLGTRRSDPRGASAGSR